MDTNTCTRLLLLLLKEKWKSYKLNVMKDDKIIKLPTCKVRRELNIEPARTNIIQISLKKLEERGFLRLVGKRQSSTNRKRSGSTTYIVELLPKFFKEVV